MPHCVNDSSNPPYQLVEIPRRIPKFAPTRTLNRSSAFDVRSWVLNQVPFDPWRVDRAVRPTAPSDVPVRFLIVASVHAVHRHVGPQPQGHRRRKRSWCQRACACKPPRLRQHVAVKKQQGCRAPPTCTPVLRARANPKPAILLPHHLYVQRRRRRSFQRRPATRRRPPPPRIDPSDTSGPRASRVCVRGLPAPRSRARSRSPAERA